MFWRLKVVWRSERGGGLKKFEKSWASACCLKITLKICQGRCMKKCFKHSYIGFPGLHLIVAFIFTRLPSGYFNVISVSSQFKLIEILTLLIFKDVEFKSCVCLTRKGRPDVILSLKWPGNYLWTTLPAKTNARLGSACSKIYIKILNG